MLDGEGFVGVVRNRRTFAAVVKVQMVERAIVARLHETYGGSLRFEAPRAPRARPQWAWVAHGQTVIPLLEDALPFLLLKAEQARIVMALARRLNPRGVAMTSEERAWRVRQWHRCQELNRRGAPRAPVHDAADEAADRRD
jgi:hypothetical protein